ncbi:MAG: cytochrome b/b6 domain-containing protein [Gammaproteobacteria bacterium]|nr:cytochrome b/b6 domain-containing protein [Gammaproteobacteria bacterium]
MKHHPGRNVRGKFLILVAVVMSAPLIAADLEPCAECHEDVHVSSTAHVDTGCLDCHSNLERAPHRRVNLQKLAGVAVCTQCHEDSAHIATSAHKELTCSDCHGEAHAVDQSQPDICADCHRRIDRTVSRSVHDGSVTCGDCHGDAHAIPLNGTRDSPVAAMNQIKSCGSCHGEPAELIDGYLTSVHGRALLVSALDNAPACTDCHGDAHAMTAIDAAKAPTSHQNSPEMCGSCHARVVEVWKQGSAHGSAWSSGNENAPVCATCHSSHGVDAPDSNQNRLAFPETCGECHGGVYQTYRDGFHGKASELGFITTAICSDCHTPHRNLPAVDPRSSVHPDNLATTCGACHGDSPEYFLSYDPHSDPTDRESNPEVYFVWLFMTGLLLAVFGFFAIHDLLWLQRSLFSLIGGEKIARPVSKGPYVRRFSSTTIRVHLVVVVTFLLLAATGLPLKFHHSDWAQTMISLFGGVEGARAFHRMAAIGTFAYVIFHLVNLCIRKFKRKEQGLLWGSNSLVPQPSDLVALWQNLRYFVYLGPKPQGDRWGYWEKFDYMAVFWGVPIIGLSGLILWFPQFFTRLLPGWALNAAQIVHSDEALLATGFIFVFHFFHTHMRPESFPMDPVIFTGRMPLERLKEERPKEYARLVESGELESIMADAPTAAELRTARIFGFSALFIGLALAIAIFWSVLAPWLR